MIKKQLYLIFCLITSFQMAAQQIADLNFAQAIRDHCPTCLDDANKITEDGRKLKNLVIAIHNINDLTGIANFAALTSLNCSHNNLTFLPPLPTGLKTLYISHNRLSDLSNLPQNLTVLYCGSNQLKTLPDLPSGLQILECSYNAILILPKMPSSLKTLFCSHNLLTNLPNLPQNLEGLECSNNRLKNLPALPQTLSLLSCQNNSELSCLPRLPDSLLYLYMSKGISCLPNIVRKAIVEHVEGIVNQPVNLPICTPIQLALCPPILPKPTEPDKKIRIFPNPTEGFLTILHQGIDIQNILVFNYLGQLVKHVKTIEINMEALASGWYLIQVHTNDGVFSEKIMKQ